MNGTRENCAKPRSQYEDTWLKIGKRNTWIREAWDPPFDNDSFYYCADTAELKEKFEHGNWCLGQAFCLGDLCFIQQVDGGDEWLTIKKDLPFESITMLAVIKSGEFGELISDLQTASLEDCRNLEYRRRKEKSS